MIDIFIVDRRMDGHPHAQERSEALIKSAIQLTRYENKMAFMFQHLTIEKQQGIIQFLTDEDGKTAAIHRRMLSEHR